MDIKYGSELVDEELDEEIGAMSMPLIGEPSRVNAATSAGILDQLENDILKIAELNKTKEPINKNLLAHFKRLHVNAKTDLKNKRKEENGT